MAYPLIPGVLLMNEVLEALPPNDQTQIMLQLAGWLKVLHTIPLEEMPADLPAADVAGAWDDLFAQFEMHLFPFMRADARDAVQVLRAELLDDLRRNPPAPALCHGDFGGGNILYDPKTRRVSGIIDFGGVSFNDPAVDVASLSYYGEATLALGYAAYPEMAALLPRARRYRATFALQQALWALDAGDEEDFEDGIAAYR
jgi:aminoglycoside 2''-phosphotransferase